MDETSTAAASESVASAKSDQADQDEPVIGRVPRRRRKAKPEAEVVLLCNPRAGGRWRELAQILDSEEARHVRRIVTDSVEDIAPAVADLGRDAKLLCIYGGDGTIQRILDRLSPARRDDIHLAMLGGGTMNVTSRWCGFDGSPGENFRAVVNAYRTGDLLLKEVPLLEVQHSREIHRGFTFGMGPIVRVLDAYERGRKGKAAALGLAMRAFAATWTGFPQNIRPLLEPMMAEVELDGDIVPHERFSALFGNVTGQINPGVAPFVEVRGRDEFHCAAYAVEVRELSLALPMLLRGWLPMDWDVLRRPSKLWRRDRGNGDLDSSLRPAIPTDPRYVNRPAAHLRIRTDETLYTVDGELLHAEGGEIHVHLGPVIKLAFNPAASLRNVVKAAMG